MNIQLVRLIFLSLFGAAAACLIGGCQTAQGDGNGNGRSAKMVGEQYWVSTDFTPFYRLGPQQATGPDLSLKKESRMTLTRKSYGYSEVVLQDGSSGWVASEDIKPIPQDVLKAENGLMVPLPPGAKGRPKSKAVVEYSEQDLPMPPPEDLILPDPDAVPVIKPEFRY